MNANTMPSNTTPSSICSSLFCLWDESLPNREQTQEPEGFLEAFSRLLPFLNFTSSCYLISQERPAEYRRFENLLLRACSFLEQNKFLQMSLRPVHPFSGKDVEEWTAVYLRYLRVCKPFQEEGYREQIIARLRIFPVVFLKDAAALREASHFLSFLQESFFLPSLLVPREAINEIGSIHGGEEDLPWVRVYVTDASCFDAQRTLEVLHAHEIFDRLLEDDSSKFPEGGILPCRESLILDPRCTVRSCIGTQGTDVSAFAQQKGEPDPSSARFSSGPGTDSPQCMACLLPRMTLVGTSYRVNPQGATAWHQLCDRMATHCVRKGIHEQAIRVWQSSAQAYPPEGVPSSLLLHIALCHYETGDLERAMEELTKAEKRAPQSPDIRYYMGKCEFAWKDYIEAADRFQEAIDLGLQNPLRVEAQYYRGLSHYHLEEYDAALEPLAEAERAGMPGSPLPFYQGLCLLGRQEPRLALSHFHEALARGPSAEDLFHVLFYIAHTCKEMGDFNGALEYLEKADRAQPMNYACWNLKGFCYFKQRNHDEAIACFQKAIEIDPTSGIDYANIASNLRDKGDIEGAIAMYRKAIELDPTIAFAHDNLGRLEQIKKSDS